MISAKNSDWNTFFPLIASIIPSPTAITPLHLNHCSEKGPIVFEKGDYGNCLKHVVL